MRFASLARYLALGVICTPFWAAAQTGAVSQVVGLFNIFVGLMLTAALLAYAVGFATWWIRLGTWPTYRTEAIRTMEWSVAILFTLVVLLAIVQFFQQHPHAAAYVISIIVVVAVIGIIVYLIAHSGGDEKEKKEE